MTTGPRPPCACRAARALRRFAPVVAAALLLVAAAALCGRLQSVRRTAATASDETAWVRYVMVGLGGFRGVISEILWIRADRLQEQGRYFELAQLSDWINALDPRAIDAWSFNAWNLAYNIGAMLPDAGAKLHWVLEGVSLLRDRAIPANPDAPALYRELGWLYQNKIGAGDDPAHLAYKLDLAADAARPAAERRHPLDPAVISDVEARLGPLDWRLPQSHAIYWAWRGLALEPTGFNRDSLRRMVQQNLVVLITAGKFTGDAAHGQWSTAPDWDLVAPTLSFFDETISVNSAETHVYRIVLDALLRLVPKSGDPALSELVARRLAELGGPPD